MQARLSNRLKTTVFLGGSDVAALTLVGYKPDIGLSAEVLKFGSDGEYYAYIVPGEDIEIGSHYKLITTFSSWLKVYDDDSLMYRCDGDLIRIYRAGDFGCIIQIINQE